MDQVTTVTGEKPLWRKIVDFPLVAMLIALAIVIACLVLTTFLMRSIVPAIPGLARSLEFDLVAIPLLIIAYELIIRRLGEHPRDDYRDPKALRNLAAGLLAGFLIFSVAVAVAAVLGVYRVTGEGDASGLVAALISPTIFAAVSEELIFRGILFRWIEAFGGSWAALFLTSAFFGAAHLANPNASPIAAVGIAFEAGVMLGAAYMLTRSLWLPM
ncbi:MAG TPA: type II CAAX endopeptidase family protein, partial [Sphingomicrobium sp.]|nr:type II CAAX endopeptidase family protein [Sphingomicrobium sp.]